MEKKLLTGLLTRGVFKKWERIMRITVLLILGFWMTVSAESFSQGTNWISGSVTGLSVM
jgi:hypothetical protein